MSLSTKLRIGLTGGIGCGKTTVLQVFRQLGVPCFIADEVAKNYYNEPDFCLAIANTFGTEMRHQDGSIDKARLADLVFNDSASLQRLNAMIHPRVAADFQQWVAAQTSPVVLFESAILYEYGFDTEVDSVVCVYLDKEERMRRLLLRDHTTRQQLERRMANQLDAEEKMLRADYVILNYEGNPRERQVRHCLHYLTHPDATLASADGSQAYTLSSIENNITSATADCP